MKHSAGLDVAVKETTIYIVDEVGMVVRETKVVTEPEAIIALLNSTGLEYERVGLEAGPLSQWLVNDLAEAGLPVICVETRHMKALLKAQQVNKSDRNDPRGIAQMLRVGLYKPIHMKTLASQQQRMLLTTRKLLRDKLQDMENELRGTLRNFGLKVGVVSPRRFEARIKELVAGRLCLEMIVIPLLAVRRVLREQFATIFPASEALLEGAERGFAGVGVDGFVNALERSRQGLAVFPGDEIEAVVEQMNNGVVD